LSGLGQYSVPNFDLPGEARRVYELIREASQAANQHALRSNPANQPAVSPWAN
jgi:hypothetical protein